MKPSIEMLQGLIRDLCELPDLVLSPDEEALGWVLAAKLDLIERIGGSDWEERLAKGSIRPSVCDALRKAGFDTPTPELFREVVPPKERKRK